jgi:lysophospholipase L1-like esterase
MQLENNKTLLFIGDSITDCGRAGPTGERAGLGDGYVRVVKALLESTYPEIGLRILNTGISGNRVTDLQTRWDEDVINHEPNYLSVMIGINDVWRQFDCPEGILQVDIEMFERVYRKLIEQTIVRVEKMILMTPFYLELNTEDPMRKKMDEYGAVVKSLAEEFNCIFVDVQAAFNQYMEKRPTQTLCGDRVHPNLTGHTVIAKAFLNAMEYKW